MSKGKEGKLGKVLPEGQREEVTGDYIYLGVLWASMLSVQVAVGGVHC